MLYPSIFGNDFFEDLMNFPTWDRAPREANRQLRRMEHEFNGLGGLMRTDVKEDKTGYEVLIDKVVQVLLNDRYIHVSGMESSLLPTDPEERAFRTDYGW